MPRVQFFHHEVVVVRLVSPLNLHMVQMFRVVAHLADTLNGQVLVYNCQCLWHCSRCFPYDTSPPSILGHTT